MPSLEELQSTDWYKERPRLIRALVDEFPPGASVIIISTGAKAYVQAWAEDGTIHVVVVPAENPGVQCNFKTPYKVFGLLPTDLQFVKENPDLTLSDLMEGTRSGKQ